MTNGETEVAATEETTETKNEAEEVIDIDLNDPQTEEAAVKIQVSHYARWYNFEWLDLTVSFGSEFISF